MIEQRKKPDVKFQVELVGIRKELAARQEQGLVT